MGTVEKNHGRYPGLFILVMWLEIYFASSAA